MLNAFPTSPLVIQAMWEFLRSVGFQGGKVLDPGCGIASFKMFCPEDLNSKISRYVGIEVEPITCGIAKRLNPDASFYTRSFLDHPCPAGSIDLAIGNVPFEDGVQTSYNGFEEAVALHARIVLKLLDLLKPGGMAFLITSTGLMDSTGAQQQYVKLREWIDARAVFLGAVRLPAQTHKDISGTQCTSDLILLQKRWNDEDDRRPYAWRTAVPSHLTTYTTHQPIPVSEYYAAFPEQLIGTPVADRTTFADDFALDWTSDQPLIEGIYTALDRWSDSVASMLSASQPTSQPASQPTSQPTEETTMYATASTNRPAWQNITVTPSTQGGIEVRFGDRPPESVTNRFGPQGFRFSSRNNDKRWWAVATPERWAWVQEFVREFGVQIEIPANSGSERVPTRAALPHPMSDEPARQPAPTPQPASTPQPAPQPAPVPTPQPAMTQEVRPTSQSLWDWNWLEDLISEASEMIEQFSEAEETTARIKASIAEQLADYEARRADGLIWNNRIQLAYIINKLTLGGCSIVIKIEKLKKEQQEAGQAEQPKK
jgi:hypothetical protein